MKKIFLIILGISLFTSGFSQFTYGPKFGINTARLANDKIMPGFQVGGFINGEFFDRIGLQADFLWTLKGNRHIDETPVLDSVGNPTTAKITIKTVTYYRFVDVPVCIYFPISKHVRGFFGPQFSVFRQAHQKVEVGGKITETDLNGITGKTSICMGFDFASKSPIIFGLRFVTNKFTGGDAIAPPTGTTVESKKLSSLMINIAYKMDW